MIVRRASRTFKSQAEAVTRKAKSGLNNQQRGKNHPGVHRPSVSPEVVSVIRTFLAEDLSVRLSRKAAALSIVPASSWGRSSTQEDEHEY